MNRMLLLCAILLATLFSGFSVGAVNFPGYAATPNIVVNDSVAGLLFTYTNHYVKSGVPTAINGVTSLVYTPDNKIYIDNILDIDDFRGHSGWVDYFTWPQGELSEDGRSFTLPNNLFLREYWAAYQTQYN